MKKNLIIGPSFFYYNNSISRAFNKLGYDTKILSYDEPVHPFNIRNAVISKIFTPNNLISKGKLLFNQYICREFDSYLPELVFIYNGDIIDPDTIKYFKTKSKVVIWLLDGLYRHSGSALLANMVDAYFCFDKTDVTTLERKGTKAYFLPQACDTSIYKPLSLNKDIDILFVGMLYGYPKRIELINSIVNHFKHFNIQIYGIYKPIYKNPVKWLFREKRDIYKNKNISPQKVNLLYNRAKICVNIHHEQSKEGANPKVFEIAGSKSFQLSDWNPYIEETFPDKEIAMYHSKDEMIDLISFYLNHDTSEQIEKAYNNVINNHTFVNRIKEVLDIIY